VRESGTPVLEIRDVSKTFAGQKALDAVSMSVRAGSVEALVGHNGSGKSTLIKILSGFHLPDRGSSVLVNSRPLKFGDPVASAREGLRFIHQQLGLIGELSVVDNLCINGSYAAGRAGPIRRGREARNAAELLDRFGIDVPPNSLLSEVRPIQWTQIAIARALKQQSGVQVVVLDEPTASLPDAETGQLFEVIRRVASEGITVVYVSHRLDELYEVADHLTVLRDGRVAGSGTPDALPRPTLVELITGSPDQRDRPEPAGSRGPESPRRARSPEPQADTGIAADALRLDGLAGGLLKGLDLEVAAGEVVGLAGLTVSGVHDLVSILVGGIPASAGTASVSGREVAAFDPQSLRHLGASVLPAAASLKSIPSLSVRENVTLPTINDFWRRGTLRYGAEREAVRRLLVEYSVRPRDPERALATLSGGNQQKAVVAKWMRTRPKLLVLEEPTAGVDVGGRLDILALIRRAAGAGMAVLVCSSNLDDLADVCDRVVIVRDGRAAAELSGSAMSRERIAAECYLSA
jgi:ribose transport system ATP-binding protein